MFRTPAKTQEECTETTKAGSSTVTKHADPEAPSVRKSIGEWECGRPERKSVTPPKTSSKTTVTTYPARPKPAAMRKLSVETAHSPPKQFKGKGHDRIAEAKACLLKAKQNLSNSRNLRADIKQAVTEAIDRLFQLVKEGASVKGQTSDTQQQTRELDEVAKEFDSAQSPSSVCRTKLETLLERHAELIRENNQNMESLKESLERRTYANVAAATTRFQPPTHTALHSVVVTAKNETETGEDVLERIRKAVNAKDGGIEVERTRKAKDRKVIVGCRTEEERNKVKERLNRAKELNVEDIKNKDPLVILRDVLIHNSNEDILKALRTQNRGIFRDIRKDDDRAEIAYKRRTRNPHTSHIVVRVSPKLWQHLTQAEAVHIDLQRVRVSDQSPLVQCSLCLGYGHGRRFCKETLEKCSHCGGPHLKAQCADWLAGATPSCCNCSHAGLERAEHNAFSSECAIRRKWDALARAAVAYC